MPRANVRIPSNLQEAATRLAAERDYKNRNEDWSKARIIREALQGYLPNQDDLPEEARDLLDNDLVSNAGGEEVADT